MSFERPWENVETDGIALGEVQVSPPIDLGSPWSAGSDRLSLIKLQHNAPTTLSSRHRDVVIDDPVWQRMILHAIKNPSIEVGGFLLGSVWGASENHERGGIWIQGMIQAEYQESTSASLRFTHDTWQAVARKYQESVTPLAILGWYHTHPNWGIFLSSMDEFICKSFFPELHHLAIVIDPARKEAGAFEWDDRRQSMLPRPALYLRSTAEQAVLRSEAFDVDG